MPTPIIAQLDRRRMKQALVNLIDNASRFSPEHSPVRIEARVEDDDLVFAVHDEGAGIGGDLLPRIFDGADPDAPAGGQRPGQGLGVVRTVARMHGGRVDVRSLGPGRGATFTVRVPLDRLSR